MTEQADDRQKLEDLIKKALKAGASAADAVCVHGESKSVSWHNGKLESLENAEGADLGLRVFFGKRQAMCSSTDHSAKALDELVARAVAMARVAPEDPYCGLADPQEIAATIPQAQDMADTYQVDVSQLIEKTKQAEAAALAVPGVTASESADAGAGRTHVSLAASNGFSGEYARTNYHIVVTAMAGEGTGMERDYDYASTVFQSDLTSPEAIGRRAGELAVRSLSPRKIESCQAPVMFDPRESRGLLGYFVGAILGNAVARGTSFLKDSMGKQLFPADVTIIDDPLRPRGLRSKLFDGEGISVSRRNIVENGVLQTWLLDLRSARQLGLKSTGHASRGTSSVPSPSASNFFIAAGKESPENLMLNMKNGLYVTETMGMGVNHVTGDFSQAARGFWIENGQIAYPVSEITIAANLKDMFASLQVANDLTFRYGIDAPTLLVENMTIAGM